MMVTTVMMAKIESICERCRDCHDGSDEPNFIIDLLLIVVLLRHNAMHLLWQIAFQLNFFLQSFGFPQLIFILEFIAYYFLKPKICQ